MVQFCCPERSAVTATSDHAPTIGFAMFSPAAAARENETLAIGRRHKIVELITDPSSNFPGEISVSRCKSLALAAGAANEKWTRTQRRKVRLASCASV